MDGLDTFTCDCLGKNKNIEVNVVTELFEGQRTPLEIDTIATLPCSSSVESDYHTLGAASHSELSTASKNLIKSVMSELFDVQEHAFALICWRHGFILLDRILFHSSELLQAHFVVAWSQYDEKSVGTWLAVDLDAKQIVAGAAGETAWPQCE